jgi:hypothetical protein
MKKPTYSEIAALIAAAGKVLAAIASFWTRT